MLCFCSLHAAKTIVPNQLIYCGLTLNLTTEGQSVIQAEVDKIEGNTATFQTLQARADRFMPFVTDAFRQLGVPEDLKYICIQESGMRADAVSKSNAVGFWQFKNLTGKEMGLGINEQIDERKHIFRASIAAGRYFVTNYLRHRNWLYSVISYYAGGTGAIQFMEDQYVGAATMTIDQNIHWYAAKAIAHKLAYENRLGNTDLSKEWLLPVSSEGETDLDQLAARHNMTTQELKRYNSWIVGNALPSNGVYSYYIPQRNIAYAHISDPHLYTYQPYTLPQYGSNPIASVKPDPLTTNFKAKVDISKALVASNEKLYKREKTSTTAVNDPFVEQLPIEQESLYGQEFIIVQNGQSLIDISQQFKVKVKKLRKWNRLKPTEEFAPGSYCLLVKPTKAQIHVVGPNETLMELAVRYQKQPERLLNYNRLNPEVKFLKEGTKIYLNGPKPRNERTIVYQKPVIKSSTQLYKPDLNAPVAQSNEVVSTPAEAAKPDYTNANDVQPKRSYQENDDEEMEEQSHHLPAAQTSEVYMQHIVGEKETLFSISRLYGVSVEQLKALNQLIDSQIHVGMELKIK
jgi:membrane-bound lytic murein transglycosylase D